jgi:hypothetical protein
MSPPWERLKSPDLTQEKGRSIHAKPLAVPQAWGGLACAWISCALTGPEKRSRWDLLRASCPTRALFGFLEPLAHCSLCHAECGSDVLLFPSVFTPFPGAHPSSFAPLFGRYRFLTLPSFSRHIVCFLSISLLRSIIKSFPCRHGCSWVNKVVPLLRTLGETCALNMLHVSPF